MKISHTNLILSLTLLNTLNTPIKDSYIIKMPLSIDIQESGSFDVGLKDCSLENGHDIVISFDEEFTLHDSHGKDDIYGKIQNPIISFTSDDQNDKTINYEVYDASCGQWSGQLNVNISINTIEASHLITGKDLNTILKDLQPENIIFSHDGINGTYLYDVSLEQNSSILLYKNGNDVIITNSNNDYIKANENMSHAFEGLSVKTISNLDYLDMSECSDVSYMFSNIANCISIGDISDWDVSNVTTLAYFLNQATALKTFPLDLSKWHITNKCKSLSHAFNAVGYTPNVNGKSIWPSSIDLTTWDVSAVKNMAYAFRNAFMISNINITGWNTSKVTDMNHMFDMSDSTERSRLVSIIGIEDIDVSNVYDMNYMFNECFQLDADFSSWDVSSIEDIRYAFYDCKALDLHMFDNWSTMVDMDDVDYKNCFGSGAGYYISPTYRPPWY